MQTHSVEEKKSLGVYYTPDNLSKVMCDWAIRKPSECVFEPSFGGCGFLDASISRLQELGATSPESNVYGVDVDERAFHFLYEKIGYHTQIKERFIHGDFIKLTPSSFNRDEFDVLIGNPPYVSVHNMGKEQRLSCKEILSSSNYTDSSLGSNANLWAFFLVHSLSFLKASGRMAWVLPSSALHADYAKKLITILEKHFLKLNLIRLNERLFKTEGAEEVSVVLFAEGFSKQQIKGEANFHIAKSVAELKELIMTPHWQFKGLKNYKWCVIGTEMNEAFEAMLRFDASTTIGAVCDVKIGLVTGANQWFTLSYKDALKHGINHRQLKPIITKFSQLNGLEHDSAAHERLKKEDSRSFLLSPKRLVPGSPVDIYLSGLSEEQRESNRTFEKRTDWFNPNDDNIPDAFLSYMFDKSATLVINKSKKVNCTNSIHRVFFKEGVSNRYARAMAISLLSSFSRLSVELIGRAYGSGVQKLEPTAAKSVCFIITDNLIEALNENWDRINGLVAKGSIDEANVAVDELICSSCPQFSADQMEQMRQAASELRSCRYEMKQEKDTL